MKRDFFAAGVALLCLGLCAAAPSRAVEPSPPDLLELAIVDESAPDGTVTLEAVVKQPIDAQAELEIAEPAGARVVAGPRKKTFALQRGGAPSRERVQIAVPDRQPRTLKAVLRLLGPDGKPWMIVERAVRVNQAQEEPADPGETRVPVVQTLPDGTKIVEYLRQKDAAARTQPAGGKATGSPGTPASPGKAGK